VNENILDSFDEEKGSSESNIKSWSSIVLLWIGIFVSVFNGLITDTITIVSIILLIIATLLTYWKRKAGVIFTLCIILLSVIGLISFYPIKYEIGISVGWVFLGFEVISLIIAAIHYYTNYEDLGWLFKDILRPSNERLLAESRRRIDGFKSRFSNKSVEELERILKLNELVPEAIQASRELLKEKNEATK